MPRIMLRGLAGPLHIEAIEMCCHSTCKTGGRRAASEAFHVWLGELLKGEQRLLLASGSMPLLKGRAMELLAQSTALHLFLHKFAY